MKDFFVWLISDHGNSKTRRVVDIIGVGVLMWNWSQYNLIQCK